MNTLHVFNPEHDIALAAGIENFTAPHAGRQLRHDLGWLPALWCNIGDTILVDDAEWAVKGYQKIKADILKLNKHAFDNNGSNPYPPIHVVQAKRDTQLSEISQVMPWGWDAALRARLKRIGIGEHALPSTVCVDAIRHLSHRKSSALLLSSLHQHFEGTPFQDCFLGKMRECTSHQEVMSLLSQWNKLVIKAPWSSSGRGVRFAEGILTESMNGWLNHVLSQQGSVMVEPYYPKVKDFGMEFFSNREGDIVYEGLSLFHTQNGAYTGNLLATEKAKQKILSKWLPLDLLKTVQETVIQHIGTVMNGIYQGPFGIDMMVVAKPNGFALHPCVEINFRRTMGHVALALTKKINPDEDDERLRVMRILFEGNQYRMIIQRI